MVKTKSPQKSEINRPNEYEIDLMELIHSVWLKKWLVVKITSIFVILGLIIAFTSPKEYETASTLIPEAAGEEGKLGGSLSGLASLAGVDLGGSSGGSQTINPALYQSVSRSTPFLMELMNKEYYFENVKSTISIFSYYMDHYQMSLVDRIISIPGSLISWIKGTSDVESVPKQNDDVLRLSVDQQSIIDDLRSRVFVEMDWDLNVVTVKVEMQDPIVAAQMVQFTQDYITNYVANYAISKSRQQLESIEKQYQERKNDFEQVQLRLASFRDKNQNVTTARARSDEERLQSEYNLAFNVYNQLAQQREAIKLQIQENTPVFTVLEPVKVPVDKSKPRRMLILALAVFLGLSVGIAFILIKNLIK